MQQIIQGLINILTDSTIEAVTDIVRDKQCGYKYKVQAGLVPVTLRKPRSHELATGNMFTLARSMRLDNAVY